MRPYTVLWLLVALAVGAAGCRRSSSISDDDLDELATAAAELVRAVRAEAPPAWSLLAVLEQRTLQPASPTPVETTARRVAAVEDLELALKPLWPRLSGPRALLPNLAGLADWAHSPAGFTRGQLEGLVERLERIDSAIADARATAGLPPRRLELGGEGPAALASPTELPALPAGIGNAGVRLWPLAEATVVLQFGADPEVCRTKDVVCLHRQVAWLGKDARLLDASPVANAPGAEDTWHAVAGGADALFTVAIAPGGKARLAIYRPGSEPLTATAKLERDAKASPASTGLRVGDAIVTPTGAIESAASDAAPADPLTRTQFLQRGEGSRDWLALSDGAVGRLEQKGAVLAFVRRAGDKQSAVRVADLPEQRDAGKVAAGGPRVVGVPLQLAYGNGTLVVAIALPPDRLVALVSRDGGRTWLGAGP